MVTAVREVLCGGSYMSHTLCKDDINSLRRTGKESSDDDRLTERQREVLQLIAEGKAMKEVGDILNIRAELRRHTDLPGGQLTLQVCTGR
jgi:DNA-binding NarL/FixJ family response regulator